ncbi:MAG TPA: UDP-N-acetylmuramoyl-L-alanine--D-glutamate ligase [Moorella mulderi]|nr:UDP-N-acetylmuramoyl-L-alanine--D-glutamate ligase [Moorella mulderi]
MEWKEQRVLVVGLGKSGKAASLALRARRAQVWACDRRELDLEEKEGLREAGVKVFSGGYPSWEEINPTLVVVSPGVPLSEPPLKEARERGVPVWGELELAYRLLPPGVQLAAITGTNGKTTTTALCFHLFQRAGLPAVLGGNIGIPLTGTVDQTGEGGWVICEASSFQLETVVDFSPRVTVILNITPDHLDRHGNFASYVAAKARLITRQDPEDYAVLNINDPVVRSLAPLTRARVLYFSLEDCQEAAAFVRGGGLYLRTEEGEKFLCHREELILPGRHNLENYLAAALVAWVGGIPLEVIAEELKTFPGVPHRLEKVREIGGVLYVNDSKGTNPQATIRALESFSRPIVLLAGGRNKGGDFQDLARHMKGRVKCLVLMGEAAPLLAKAAAKAGMGPVFHVRDLREAVLKAAEVASPGDVVLLSPACASWDMFANYEERGDLFKQFVIELEGRR